MSDFDTAIQRAIPRPRPSRVPGWLVLAGVALGMALAAWVMGGGV